VSFHKMLYCHYLESVHNVDTLWTDFLEKRIFAAFRRENARSVHKVTGFVDRHYLCSSAFYRCINQLSRLFQDCVSSVSGQHYCYFARRFYS
jgi:hypothetical protein